MSLANGTTAELKGNEAWIFALRPVSVDPRTLAGMAALAPGALTRRQPDIARLCLLPKFWLLRCSSDIDRTDMQEWIIFLAVIVCYVDLIAPDLTGSTRHTGMRWPHGTVSATTGMCLGTMLAAQQCNVRPGCPPVAEMRVLVHHASAPQDPSQVQVGRPDTCRT